MTMTFEEFRKKMGKAETMKQGDALIAQLTNEQLEQIVDSLMTVKEFSGITMRDEYILSMAKIFLEKPEHKKFYLPKIKKEVV